MKPQKEIEGEECERLEACAQVLDALEKTKGKQKKLEMLYSWTMKQPWKDCRCGCCLTRRG